MCETCGVTTAQYRRAKWLLKQQSWATLYHHVGRDPALMGIDEPTKNQQEFINNSLTAYTPVHRDELGGTAMTAAEWHEWFDHREIERAAEIAAATEAGC